MFKVFNLILVVLCTACAYTAAEEGRCWVCILCLLGAIFNFVALIVQVY